MYNLWERIKYTFVKVFSNRLFVLIAVFCMMFSILIIRLFNLQIVNGQKYQDNYKLQIQKTRVLQGTRGNIYDRNGKLLAYNELAYSVTIEDNGSSVFTDDEELNKEIQQHTDDVQKQKPDAREHDHAVLLIGDQLIEHLTGDDGVDDTHQRHQKGGQHIQGEYELVGAVVGDEAFQHGVDSFG